MNHSKHLVFFVVWTLGTAACNKDPLPPDFTLDDLSGKWMRVEGNKPEYDSMVIEVRGDLAKITHLPDGDDTYFQEGAIKWLDITPLAYVYSEAHFHFYHLASTGEYYQSAITMASLEDSVLYINLLYDNKFDGDKQTWRRLP